MIAGPRYVRTEGDRRVRREYRERRKRLGLGRGPTPYLAETFSIRTVFSPWGDLILDEFRFTAPKARFASFVEVVSDLMPTGSTYALLETEEDYLPGRRRS